MSEADVNGTTAEVEPSHQYPITFCCHACPRNAHWSLRCVYWRPNSRWECSEGWVVHSRSGAVMWKRSHTADGMQLLYHEMKNILISSSAQTGNCIWNWTLASMYWKEWWQCWDTTKAEPGESHNCSQRNRKNTVCQFARTCWTNTRLKVMVSWIASLLLTIGGVTSTSHSQTSSPWRVTHGFPYWRRSSRHSLQLGMWCEPTA